MAVLCVRPVFSFFNIVRLLFFLLSQYAFPCSHSFLLEICAFHFFYFFSCLSYEDDLAGFQTASSFGVKRCTINRVIKLEGHLRVTFQ